MSDVQGSGARVTRRSGKKAQPVPELPSQVIAPGLIKSSVAMPADDDEQLELDTSPIEDEPAFMPANPNMPVWSNPGQQAVVAGPNVVKLRSGHDYSGEYVTKVNINVERRADEKSPATITKIPPGTTIWLSDEEARHFLPVRAVASATDQDGEFTSTQDFSGPYEARVNLNLEKRRVDADGKPAFRLDKDDKPIKDQNGDKVPWFDIERVKPGAQVMLTDEQARHFLKSGTVRSLDGFRI